MGARRLDGAGLAALAAAVADPVRVQRWRDKTVTVPGSECRWWTGAVSGRVVAVTGVTGASAARVTPLSSKVRAVTSTRLSSEPTVLL